MIIKYMFASDLAHEYYNSFTLAEVVPELIIRDAVLYYFWVDMRLKLWEANNNQKRG